MAIKSVRGKTGYAAWILKKVLDELTGNYFENAATEKQARPLAREDAPKPNGNIVYVEEFDRSNDVGLEQVESDSVDSRCKRARTAKRR